MRIRILLLTAAAAFLTTGPAAAQAGQRETVVEVLAARGAFLDDAPIDHSIIGASARWYVNSLASVGPEVTYMVGPDGDRDLFVTGNLTVDFRETRAATRVVPYVLIGAGLFNHRDTFAGQAYSSSEWALTAGGGVRIAATPRLWIAPELRVGWEPHIRLGVTVGYRLKG